MPDVYSWSIDIVGFRGILNSRRMDEKLSCVRDTFDRQVDGSYDYTDYSYWYDTIYTTA